MPRVSAPFAAKTPPSPCVSTAPMAKDPAFALRDFQCLVDLVDADKSGDIDYQEFANADIMGSPLFAARNVQVRATRRPKRVAGRCRRCLERSSASRKGRLSCSRTVPFFSKSRVRSERDTSPSVHCRCPLFRRAVDVRDGSLNVTRTPALQGNSGCKTITQLKSARQMQTRHFGLAKISQFAQRYVRERASVSLPFLVCGSLPFSA